MEDEDMAAAMGFSSFGAKKRKFGQTSSPKAHGDASGANSTELGVRPKRTTADGANHEAEATGQGIVGRDSAVPTSQRLPDRTASNTKGKQKQPAATGLASFLARGQNLPDKPPAAQESQIAAPIPRDNVANETMVSFGGPSISLAKLNALRYGIKDENGDTAYFQPSFVEDPWENLKNNQRRS